MIHDHDSIIQQLLAVRSNSPHTLPSPQAVPALIDTVLELLFPHFERQHGEQLCAVQRPAPPEQLRMLLTRCTELLKALCISAHPAGNGSDQLIAEFISELPHFGAILREDAEAIYRGDPAAASVDEVILAYPGFLAIAVYRIAHWLQQRSVRIVPRMMTEYAHRLTGVDIHPGAQIGRAFVIDHGTGIVIGETCVIEDNVKIFQGVTLGALSVDKSLAATKRHPTIERDVVLYANATILGGSTVVGHGSIIGGNVWLTASVAPHSRIYHRAEVTVR
jgi:serine O-acetyltransferase